MSGKIMALTLAAVFVHGTACSSVIFQDNFDNCTSGCVVSPGDAPNSAGPYPAEWLQWYNDPPNNATYDNVTKYAGEITAPGRGGSGMSLKLWRNGDFNHSYNGALLTSSPGTYSDFYMRFYAKISPDMNMTGGNYIKMFRVNTSSGEIYVNVNPGAGDVKSTGQLQVMGESGWKTILTNSQLMALWDGNWHAWQFRFNLSSNTLTFWVDGGEPITINSAGFSGAWNSYLQHFPLGNADGTWQSSWQAFEVDDLVIATTKEETDPINSTRRLSLAGSLIKIVEPEP